MRRLALSFVAILTAAMLGGCFSRHPVRHLASDIGLVNRGASVEEVQAILGPPDHQKKEANVDVWIYVESRKSFLRKTPYLGDRLGSERFEVATVSFRNGLVVDTSYRALSEEEFSRLGLPREDDLGR